MQATSKSTSLMNVIKAIPGYVCMQFIYTSLILAAPVAQPKPEPKPFIGLGPIGIGFGGPGWGGPGWGGFGGWNGGYGW